MRKFNTRFFTNENITEFFYLSSSLSTIKWDNDNCLRKILLTSFSGRKDLNVYYFPSLLPTVEINGNYKLKSFSIGIINT